MRIALPFQDDSSLFFAAHLGRELRARGLTPLLAHIVEDRRRPKISERQLRATLGEAGPDLDMVERAFMADGFLANFEAVIVSKVTALQRQWVARAAWRAQTPRPCFVAFQPGLEFTPEKGTHNRRHFDVVFANTPADLDILRDYFNDGDPRRRAAWGHPYFVRPPAWRRPAPDAPVYFFTQAICPPTLLGRTHMLRVLAALARLHPRREIVLKLRHRSDENAEHAHREAFAYEWLVDRFLPRRPANLRFDDGTMDAALERAGIALTCTSTAAMDAIRAGVPSLLYLDYVENHRDYTVEPMRRLFGDSGLIAPLPRLLDLDVRPPDGGWLARNFRGPDLYDELLDAIAAFRRRPARAAA